MKRAKSVNWISMFFLAFLALPAVPLAGQIEVQHREFREQEREALQALRIAREHAEQARLQGVMEGERALRIAREHAEQARLQHAVDRERNLHRTQDELQRVREEQERVLREVREGQRDRLREIQQAVVRVRARVRLGLSLDGDQDGEYAHQGARVLDVLEDSPAEAAGIQEDDIITHITGHSLLSPIPGEEDEDFDEDASLPVQRLLALAGELEDGESVELRYLRDGSAETVTMEAREMESNWVSFRNAPNAAFFGPRGEGGDLSFFRGDNDFAFHFMRGAHIQGLELRELNPELGEYFSATEGVLVMEVDEDSSLGLRAGDVILAIDNREVEDRGDVFRILGSYEEEEAVSFTVMRRGAETRVEGTIG